MVMKGKPYNWQGRTGGDLNEGKESQEESPKVRKPEEKVVVKGPSKELMRGKVNS